MKRLILGLALIGLVAVNSVAVADNQIEFDDGSSHTFDDNTYQDVSVWLDFFTFNDPGTHINLVNNGAVGSLYAYKKASIAMSGGSVGFNVTSRGNSTVNVSGGTIGYHLISQGNGIVNLTNGSVGSGLQAWNNSIINMSGGIIGDRVGVWDEALITISGGTINNGFTLYKDAFIYLVGTDFEINGNPLVAGDKLSDFGTRIENGEHDYFTGTITGTLLDGSSLNNDFMIFNLEYSAGIGDIIIVHKPVTIKVEVDIKPQSCPNPLNTKSQGILPIAI